MVFFTCNACGQSIKKNQVEKHYLQQCRNCEVLSCLDCGKDFWGDDYKTHIKCITEDEKYGGKDFKPKPNMNKGEKKQEMWIQHVQHTIATTQVSPELNNVMQQLITFQNIPKKKIKFMNFIKNSVRLKHANLAEKAWEIFDKAQKQEKEDNKSQNAQAREETNGQNSENHEQLHNKAAELESIEKSFKAKHKQKDKSCESLSENNLHVEEDEGQYKTKRKAFDQNEDSPKKKKKHELETAQMPTITKENDQHENVKPAKFKWRKIIKAVLEAESDKELSIKKLRKKVLREYESMGGDARPYTREELNVKFQKKLQNSAFKVHKDRVKLLG